MNLIKHLHRTLAVMAGALMFCAAAQAEDAPAACALKRVASLDIGWQKEGITVPVTIGGQDRPMLLSYGVEDSAITRDLARGLGARLLPLSHGSRIEYADQTVTWQAVVPDLKIGAIQGRDVHVLVLDDPKPIGGAAGVIGSVLLGNVDAEFDFKNNNFNLYSQDHCPGAVVYWSDTATVVPFERNTIGEITLGMTLDGKPVKVQLEMASHARMGANIVKALFGEDAKAGQHAFKTLEIGGLTIQNPQIEFFADESMMRCDGRPHAMNGKPYICYGGADLYLGLGELKQLHLFFAFKEKKLYITAADAHK
jgi:hypothetical protein